MGDFLLDLRPVPVRNSAAADSIRYHPSQNYSEYASGAFGLSLTCPGNTSLWAPYTAGDGSFFAVAGMAALEDSEWDQAAALPGEGGLAAKAIARLYQSGGLRALEKVSGNCALIAFDAPARQIHLVADAAGAFPVFECETADGWVIGSHPDTVAMAAGEQDRRDEVSMAEFLIASTVTPPHTYYQRVRAMDHGTSLTVDLTSGAAERRRHFDFAFRGSSSDSEQELAAQLATALKDAIRRRTHPRFGTPVIALSGGADSRLLLACMDDPSRAIAFTCYDQPNRELRTAEKIAAAAGARFLPLQRGPDYYADNAAEGVRISGGMGTFANNHFLGILDRLHAEGMGVLLTGCYFDYMFKGLPLNRRENRFTGRESLAPFSHEFYFSQWMPATPLAAQVKQRWEARIPVDLQKQSCDADVFGIESRRTFPLCYEGDNQQRLVPQRLAPWFVPVADRRVLDAYSRIPGRMKLNRSVFLKAARILLAGTPAGSVPDANTGAPLFASPLRTWASNNVQRIQRKLRTRHRTLASDGSWPDWQYYVAHSPRMDELWQQSAPGAMEFFRRVLGWNEIPAHPRDFAGSRTWILVSLLTQKLWLQQRTS